MGKRRLKHNPEVLRQIRQLRRKVRESRTLPRNDRFAYGKNQTQTHLINFKEKKENGKEENNSNI